ncbi:MAG: phosphoglucosamine mutase [Bryobacteraceae bacterium]|nr:phosphoglucosamine mutase [Bryobacteraceae bacterium]
MGKRLFGTDGIRGVAGEFPLDAPTAHAAGIALGEWARQHSDRPDVVVGIDTRESGPWLASAIAGGLSQAGARCHFAGVITTPGVAYLTRTEAFVAGVMISASHNPYQDNGVKVFGHTGYKLPDEEEHVLETEILRLVEQGAAPAPVALPVEESLARRYLDYLASTCPPLSGISLVADCGHGAASQLAPRLFERLGADVHAICRAPDGRNINRGCGALHPEAVRDEVLRRGAGLGVAFDGDADRAIFASRSGRIVDGDAVLLVCGRALLERGRLTGDNGTPMVVATVMSNLGLEKALAARGVKLVRTPVGDKYVLEEMLRRNAALGGEQSGHVIFRDYATTGDGLLTALRVLQIMKETGQDLDALTAEMVMHPQRLVNVRVGARRPLEELALTQAEIHEAERALNDSGRVLVRFSGTEPLVRVMVEAADAGQVDRYAERIAAAVRAELGGAN